MENITKYALLAVIVSVCSATLSLLLKKEKIKKYFRYIVGLCLFSAFLIPVYSSILSIPDYIKKYSYNLENYSEEIADEMLLKVQAKLAKENTEKSIEELIRKKFGINESKAYVTLDISDYENIEIILIELYVGESEYTNKVREYIFNEFNGETEVVTVDKRK